MLFPSGDQMAPSAPVEIFVTWRGWPSSPPLSGVKLDIQIWVGSVAFEVQIRRFPSGENRGRSSWFGVWFNRRASPPAAGTIQRCEIFVFASRSTSTASNTTHLPSGEGTGAPTRFNFIMSSNVKGCFALAFVLVLALGVGICANADMAIANERVRILQCIVVSPP